ncbi:adenylosuccinate lyase [Candidatus Daviesbacteria bacterium RIFCSPLOWO2_02_FULL_38_18]|nr:MAG: adenylosuccinate lyase [Candidatus Daviesbacteria bacterium RIFCSPHIGHO2_02_FULL_39_41]OGE44075.1 MAG: adenylosuccinate lyase [Candidatus Daviesbacteria bacterium RIFCSPHIGHO2_12_FULL_38_25]OGE68260.1 MAG: adenylosuccinate lyase [Candidatus Daviesbacteria bacterium RIFCSPLOWO2_02_FULL_38_18]OGE72253.1 MAG: adenylosuccinate lyase [Candidatus Daviesbacteria bacterium RIFCSPLOWO2_12_FULL_38_10]
MNMKYESPFSWRYGSEKMREIFSEENKYRLWRKIWVALARAQNKNGLVGKEELEDLEKNQDNLDIERIWEIEKDTRHDVVAAIKEFVEKAKIGGGKIHLGATSMDISDNAETIRMQEALEIIENKLTALLKVFGRKIEKYADFVCMGYTHLQPAEPTTLGYRFAFYAQDLLLDLELLQFVKKNLKSKGIKGAVGTSASFVKLLDEKKAEEMEAGVLKELRLEAFEITNQTAPRKIEFWIGSLLSSIAESLNKFAFDLRIMQSPGFGEWQEPFGSSQVGSSAMPFKKNPIKAEQICSLARLVVNLSRTTWDNAASQLLERTLDDSANRRVVIPEMFLAIDEMLSSATKIIDGLTINDKRITKNMDTYWPFSATESIILEAVKKGADRQKMHEVLREISLKAEEGNSMQDLLESNPEIAKFLKPAEIDQLLDAKNHVGNAPKKALELVGRIKKI